VKESDHWFLGLFFSRSTKASAKAGVRMNPQVRALRSRWQLLLGSLLTLKNTELTLNRFGSRVSGDHAQIEPGRAMIAIVAVKVKAEALRAVDFFPLIC
jgi:hypothetical protein